uniref:Uncharacterized protein n=1 Tax=Picea glauca TaxID=3330 RepID=A0A101M3U9_PICGL|nr:hypothetical protein ABT39_MTgene425 [Picea glauca]QHR91289.1 hypothetical protein Q903MT_gene5321 [Picea sitchensis]
MATLSWGPNDQLVSHKKHNIPIILIACMRDKSVRKGAPLVFVLVPAT